MSAEILLDYRVQELLAALNEGVLQEEFVRTKLSEWAGEAGDLIHYSDGEYDILTNSVE